MDSLRVALNEHTEEQVVEATERQAFISPETKSLASSLSPPLLKPEPTQEETATHQNNVQENFVGPTVGVPEDEDKYLDATFGDDSYNN